MHIEVATAISAIAMIVTVINVFSGLRRASKNETRADIVQLVEIKTKLDTIGDDVSEIKSDYKDIKKDIKAHGEKLVEHEQQLKSLNKAVFDSGKGI